MIYWLITDLLFEVLWLIKIDHWFIIILLIYLLIIAIAWNRLLISWLLIDL